MISDPSPNATPGGSIQAKATRRLPTATARPPPASVTVLDDAIVNVFSVITCVVLFSGGSPVPTSSYTRSPAAGYSTVSGLPTPRPGGQFGIGSTLDTCTRPYPCSLFPITPTFVPSTVPRSPPRDCPIRRSVDVGYPVTPLSSMKFALATRAAFTSAPDTFPIRSAVFRFPLG